MDWLLILRTSNAIKPYKLTMDFVSNSCKLNTGRQELDLDDGISRLVSKLERTNA